MPSWPDEAAGRATSLAVAGWNVARLPSAAVSRELSSDAGHAYPQQLPTLDFSTAPEAAGAADVAAMVHSMLGTKQFLVTGSGRDAEAVVASALVEPGQRVVANEAYVSGKWWIERFGGSVENFGSDPLGTPGTPRNPGDLAFVLMTLPPAQLGPDAGRPVSLAEVQAVRSWIDRCSPDAPLVIDASRLWANAAASETDPADFLALADIIMLSAGKDIGASRGGLVAGSGRWWPRLVEAAHVWHGSSIALDDHDVANIAHGMSAVRSGAAHDRYAEMMELADDLAEMGLPRTWPGCGSIYLDVDAWMPQVSRRELPAQTLLNVIYLLTGWRGLGTAADDAEPAGQDGQVPTVRLAVRDAASALRDGLAIVAEVAARLQAGLRSSPRDRTAPYLQPALPIDLSGWPSVPCSSLESATSGWLVARPASACGPQRALAEVLTRVAPGSALQTSDRVLRDLHHRFTRLTLEPSPHETMIVDAVRLSELADHEARSDATILVDIEAPDLWPAVAAMAELEDIDVFWAAADGDETGQHGLVAVRVGSPLADALDAGSLFTLSTWLTSTI